jgi:hypothetical protein
VPWSSKERESEARVVTGGGDGWVNYQGKKLKQNFLSKLMLEKRRSRFN